MDSFWCVPVNGFKLSCHRFGRPIGIMVTCLVWMAHTLVYLSMFFFSKMITNAFIFILSSYFVSNACLNSWQFLSNFSMDFCILLYMTYINFWPLTIPFFVFQCSLRLSGEINFSVFSVSSFDHCCQKYLVWNRSGEISVKSVDCDKKSWNINYICIFLNAMSL